MMKLIETGFYTTQRGQDMAVKVARPMRAVPDDFEIIFVEQGRLECEAWYRVGRTTVNRWLREAGEDRLITKRAAYVKHRRDNGTWLTRASNLVGRRVIPRTRTAPVPPRDHRYVSPALLKRATRFLQCVANGGWRITAMNDGRWRAGTLELWPGQLLDLAVRKGFDRHRATQQIEAEGE